MSQHPEVIEAMHKAIEQYGAGSGGHRNIGGTHSYFEKIENVISDWHGKEADLVFPTDEWGYARVTLDTPDGDNNHLKFKAGG